MDLAPGRTGVIPFHLIRALAVLGVDDSLSFRLGKVAVRTNPNRNTHKSIYIYTHYPCNMYYVYIYMYVDILNVYSMYICTYIYIYTYMCIYVYIAIYIYIYMYICIHITGVNNWTKHIYISGLYLLKKAIVIYKPSSTKTTSGHFGKIYESPSWSFFSARNAVII